jgi:hypothetical protein
MNPGDIEMREFSQIANRDEMATENDSETLQATPTTSHCRDHKILTSSVSPPFRRRQKPAGDHLFIDPQSDMKMTQSLPGWLVSRGKKVVDPDEYQIESWTNFHKKYSSQAYRTSHNMKFSEIRKQQRRESKPSFGERVLRRLGRQSNQCINCGSAQCDGTCSIFSSPSSQTTNSFAKKQKSLSPFSRRASRK